MSDIQLYTKLSGLSDFMKAEVSDFIDFLQYKSKVKSGSLKRREPGKAKGLIEMNDGFEDFVPGFEKYS